MLKKPLKRKFILVFVAIFIFAINSMAFAEGTDLENHWAKTEIEYLIEKGIVSGYNDGTFKPDKEITRAEFIKIINNVLGYSEKAEISFTDVKESEWYYEDIQKGVAAGYIGGYSDGTMKPNKPITRQEVAKVIAIAYDLDRYTSVSSNSFTDSDSIDEWAKNYIGIMKDKELITGYSDGSFSPKKNVTRGEIAKIIYSASGEIVNDEGVFSKDIDGNIVVNVSNVELKNMTVKGDLYLAEGIGEGSVFLEGVNIEGNVYIRGGGQNSIKIGNCNINNMIINKPANTVRVLLKENAKVSSIAMERNGKVVVESGAKVENVVAFEHSNIEVQSGGNISSLEVAGKNVVINSKGNIDNVVANEEISINGSMLAKGSQAKVEGGKVKVKGEKPSETSATPSTGGGGGGGYTGGGGSGDGGTGGEDKPVETPRIEAKFVESPVLKNFGKVSIVSIKGVPNYESFTVTFKYSDGVTEDTIGPALVNGGETTEIYYNGEFPVIIKIFNKDGKLLYTFNNVTLKK